MIDVLESTSMTYVVARGGPVSIRYSHLEGDARRDVDRILVAPFREDQLGQVVRRTPIGVPVALVVLAMPWGNNNLTILWGG